MSVNLKTPSLRGLALCLLMLFAQQALADVYTYVDADGNRVFTDQPRRNAKKMDIAPSNEIKAAPHQSRAPSTPSRPGPLFSYQLLRILAPEPDSTVRDMQGNLNVTVTNDPALQPSHSYRLLLDGKPFGKTGRSPVFPLTFTAGNGCTASSSKTSPTPTCPAAIGWPIPAMEN